MKNVARIILDFIEYVHIFMRVSIFLIDKDDIVSNFGVTKTHIINVRFNLLLERFSYILYFCLSQDFSIVYKLLKKYLI